MDYAAELKELLRPTGLYAVDRGLCAAELDSIGGELDDIWKTLETAETESNPNTAEGTGLKAWDELLPFVPSSKKLTDHRRAICALLRIDGMSFTRAAINDTLAGCGIRAVAEETATPMTVKVSFPADRGVPENFEELRQRIEQILPCHLAVEYGFIYVTWAELERIFASWTALETEKLSWTALERCGGEVE